MNQIVLHKPDRVTLFSSLLFAAMLLFSMKISLELKP